MKKRDKIILGIIVGTCCALIPIVVVSLGSRSKAVMAPAQVVMVEEETSEEETEVESTEDMESFDETIETMPEEETTEESSTYEETTTETKVFEETTASNEKTATVETKATEETQPSTEAVKETVKETEAPTKAPETVAETTVAQKAPETTAAPKVSSGDWNVSSETVSEIVAQGNDLINVYEDKAEFNYGDITLNKNGNEYTFEVKVNLSKSFNRDALKQLSKLTAINGVGDLLLNDNDNEIYQLDTWQDMGNGHQVYVSQSGKTLTYKVK